MIKMLLISIWTNRIL